MDKLDKYIDRLLTIAVEYIPKLAMAIVFLVVGLWLIKRIAVLAEKAMQKRDLEVSLRTFLKSLISVGLKIMLMISVAGMIGFQTTSLVAVLGAAGLAVGLALQGSLANFAGGVLVMFFKPYRVGDMIEVLGQTGEVKEIQIFNTILLTGQNKTVILPNGAVSNGHIINYSRHGNIRCDIDVRVAFNTDIDKVRAIATSIFETDDRILKDPAPAIYPGSFDPGGLILHVRPYTTISNYWGVYYYVHESLVKAFETQNIEVPVISRPQ